MKSHTPFQGILSPLSVPDYRRLIIGNTFWWLMMWMEQVIVGWLVLEITNSPWKVALIGFYRTFPLLIVGLFSGVVLRRFNRKRVILAAQALYLTIFLAFAGLFWAGRLGFTHLALGEFLIGVGWAHEWPARRAFLPELLGRSRVVDGMVLENLASNLAVILGPFAGGVLMNALGPLGGLLTLASVALLGGLSLWRLNAPPNPPRRPSVSPLRNVAEGLRYVRGRHRILGVLLITFLMNVFLFSYVTLLPVFARDVLGRGAVGFGLLGTATGVGAFLGTFLVSRLQSSGRSGWVFAGGSLLQSAAVAAFAASTSYPLSLVLLLLAGIGQAGFVVLQSAIVLVAARDEMRERVLGALVVTIGGGPLGQLTAGALASAFGAPLAVGTSGATALLSIACVTAALPGLRAPDESLRDPSQVKGHGPLLPPDPLPLPYTGEGGGEKRKAPATGEGEGLTRDP